MIIKSAAVLSLPGVRNNNMLPSVKMVSPTQIVEIHTSKQIFLSAKKLQAERPDSVNSD